MSGGMMLDSITRTVIPVIVGHLLAWAAMIGLHFSEGAVTEIVAVVLTAAYYALARLIERRWPGLGKVLLSAGLAQREPVYVRSGAKLVVAQVEPDGEHWPQPGAQE